MNQPGRKSDSGETNFEDARVDQGRLATLNKLLPPTQPARVSGGVQLSPAGQTARSHLDGLPAQSKQDTVITWLREVTGNEAHGGFKL